jgi:hypothetical protein
MLDGLSHAQTPKTRPSFLAGRKPAFSLAVNATDDPGVARNIIILRAHRWL